MKPELEICCYSVESVRAAARGGADRVELCASPPEGGVTPSHACIELAREVPGIGLYVIIRPRGGDFCYSPDEFECMKRDIVAAGSLGADGVVTGILTPEGHVDKARTSELVKLAGSMDVTFHRAFDMCADPLRALDDIYECGIRRVLTSGTRNTVDEGLEVLTGLVGRTEKAGLTGRTGGTTKAGLTGRVGEAARADKTARAGEGLAIMAGSGVKLQNLESLYRAGIRQFHSTASKTLPSSMQYRNPHIQMGKEGGVDEYALSRADETLVRAMRRRLDELQQFSEEGF